MPQDQWPEGSSRERPHFDHLWRMALSLEVAGMTKEDMATALHRSVNTIRNWLKGTTHIDYASMVTWAKVTGVDFEWMRDQSYDPDAKSEARSRGEAGEEFIDDENGEP
jgi:transcriptional regulator with XRE-family HTH domain